VIVRAAQENIIVEGDIPGVVRDEDRGPVFLEGVLFYDPS